MSVLTRAGILLGEIRGGGLIAVSRTILFVAVVVLKQQKSTAVPFLLCCIVLLCICRHANWRRKTNRFIEEVWSAVKAVPNREEVERI